jgi:hypothetical protein
LQPFLLVPDETSGQARITEKKLIHDQTIKATMIVIGRFSHEKMCISNPLLKTTVKF